MGKTKYRYMVGEFAFVPHPIHSATWLRVCTSVLKVTCPACQAAVGSPCMNRGEAMTTGAHWRRRKAAKGKPLKLRTTGLQILLSEIEIQ